MVSMLLAVIYLSFISLGLPDSLLGAAWPVMRPELAVSFSSAGIVTMIIAGGTILSSLLSDRLTQKFGAGLVTAVSVLMTAIALFGFSVSSAFWMLCLWSIPYGFGAGAVDAALNNYVALHFSSRHMSWLHCFWGVGAAISPYIMSFALTGGYDWHTGYRIVSVIQMVLTAILFVSLPLWKKRKAAETSDGVSPMPMTLPQIFRVPGVPFVLILFFSYCALESTAGLWASSYLVVQREISAETAAQFASFYYLGITVGRFLCGFVADRIGDRGMIRIGILVTITGTVFLMIPFSSDVPALVGLLVVGFGCAPVYPSVIHATPANFGKDKSQAIVGVQMASAYVGTTFMPPLFGLIAEHITVALYPFYLVLFAVFMLIMSELLARKTGHISPDEKKSV